MTGTEYEHTGPFDAGVWLTGARVRFADDGQVIDVVKAPERLVYRYAGAEHEVFGQRLSDPDAPAVRFRVAPWMAQVGSADLTTIVGVDDVVTLEERGTVVVVGTVNGPAIDCTDPATSEDFWMVPCWTAREGREATTIYVDSRNVLGVILPEPYTPATGKRGPR